MGTFKQLLADQKLDAPTLVRLSRQLENRPEEDRQLAQRRWDKRHGKDTQAKSYTELGIGKPRSGRGVSAQQVAAALEDKPLSPRVRGKLVRAVNAALGKKGGAAVDFKALFGEIAARKGEATKGAKGS